MKNLKILFFIMLAALQVSAATLNCSYFKNFEKISSWDVDTEVDDRILVKKWDDLTIYLTEKSNLDFDLELFIPDIESRIYSTGSLTEKNKSLKESIWSRNYILEVDCSRK